MAAFLCVIVALLVMALSESTRARTAPQAAASEKQAAWDKLADEYFDEVYFKFAPSSGTAAGLHQYDALLEDYSRAGVDANVAALRAFEKRVEAVDPTGLDETRAADRELVLSNIQGTLLTLETIRPWEKNPDYLFERDQQQRVRDHDPEVCVGGRAAAVGGGARREDAGGVCGSARKLEESAADLHGDCAGAVAGHHQFFSERRAGGFCRRDGSGGESGVCEIECRGDRGFAELRGSG